MGLVHSICSKAHKKVGQYVEYDDLVGFGAAGLLEAADRFDETVGTAFSTFSYYRIRGAVYDGLRDMGHIPRGEYQKLKAAQRADEYLESMAQRDAATRQPGQPPVATSTEDDLRAMYEAMANTVTIFVTSLDAHVESGKEIAELGKTAEEKVALVQMGKQIAKAIEALPERERHFIQKHYYEGKTLLEAGKDLGLSKSWSSRLHGRAVELLRKQLAKQHAL
jgi:RNA polymerase sigma factor for flagellar operon FliA